MQCRRDDARRLANICRGKCEIDPDAFVTVYAVTEMMYKTKITNGKKRREKICGAD